MGHVLRIGSQDVFKSNDRRGFDKRFTLLSQLSYVPGSQSGYGGTRTHNPRVFNHVLQSAVGHVSWRRSRGQRHFRTGIEPAGRKAVPRLTGRSRCTPTGSRRCIQMPNEGLPRAAFTTAVRTSNRSRRLLTGPFVFERLQRRSLAGRPASLP